ncbi:MAG: hypothetical protein LWY06_03240 [Firmicutes bacterium]|nr:hypothetical protein [Bacillota bacterium]
MITISLKSIARKEAIIKEKPVEIDVRIDQQGFTSARDLISSVVRYEVAAFRERNEESKILRTLTAQQIEEGRDAGKIIITAQEDTPDQPPVNENRAVKTALQAFEDGLFYMLVNNKNIRDPEELIPANQDLHIIFIKLTALEGG